MLSVWRRRPNGAIPFGRYWLMERIGRGGMAEVWKAIADRGAAPVCIKRVLPELSHEPEFVSMFSYEAQLSARLDHPAIVRVIEYDKVGHELYIAMELIDGVNLSTALKRLTAGGAVPVGLALQVAHELALALGYAHALCDERGQPLRIIHRDVSPSNVMLTADGRVKLLDFGIAKALAAADRSTRTDILKGKLSYMAPERADDGDPDHRSDLFSVGVILHEMLTGRRLFKGRDDLHALALLRECKVPPPSQARPELDGAIDRLCARLLARDPTARVQSGEELAAELRTLMAKHPWRDADTAALLTAHGLVGGAASFDPAASPTTVQRKLGARDRRSPLAVAAAVAVLAAATVVALARSHAPSPAIAAPSPIAAPAPSAKSEAPPVAAPPSPTVEPAPPPRAPSSHTRKKVERAHAAHAHAKPPAPARDDDGIIKDFR